MPKPLNTRAWSQAKISALKERGLWKGTLDKSMPHWDARVAQRATQIYTDRGNKWEGGRPGSSLARWTKEEWTHVLGDPEGRYLPSAVQDQMSYALKLAENRAKKACTARGEKRCPYLPETARLMRNLRSK